MINGKKIVVDSGSFSHKIEIVEGKNVIKIYAKNNSSGIVFEKSINVTRELSEEEKVKRNKEELEKKKIEEEKKKDEDARNDGTVALSCAKNYVKNSLKSPKTADFPWSIGDVTALGNDEYKVAGYVDSENSFSALIRTFYECEVKVINAEDFECVSSCYFK